MKSYKKQRYIINKQRSLEKKRVSRKNKGMSFNLSDETYGKKEKYRTTKFINLLFEKNIISNNILKNNQLNEKSSQILITIPKIFSLSENYEETMETLFNIIYNGLNPNVSLIRFSHEFCETLELSTSTIMDEILIEINNYRRRYYRNDKLVHYMGKLSTEDNVNDMLIISGVIRRLSAKCSRRLNSEIKTLDLLIDITSGVGQTKILEFLQECFIEEGFTFTETAGDKICQMVGEIIDNANRHAGKYCKSFVIGHCSFNRENEYGECHLSIFNWGDTIYETLDNMDESSYIKKQLAEITQKHINLFKFNNKWTKEALWTLYALQEGVSRFRNTRENSGGTGTIDFLTSFSEFKSNIEELKPMISITSGKTQIIIDGTYELEEKNGYKVIAFNKNNDLYEPPDEEYVKILNNSFPGTVISIRFYIDKKYLSRKVDV